VTRLRRIADRDQIFFLTTNLRSHTPALTGGDGTLSSDNWRGNAPPMNSSYSDL
jgi:hypothetical protein